MSEQTKLNIANKESVALELARQIAMNEKLSDDTATYRKNFLDLYVECRKATYGNR